VSQVNVGPQGVGAGHLNLTSAPPGGHGRRGIAARADLAHAIRTLSADAMGVGSHLWTSEGSRRGDCYRGLPSVRPATARRDPAWTVR